MKINSRINFFKKKLAQQAATPTSSSTTTTPAKLQIKPVNVQAIPGYNSNLFALRPDLIPDINNIVNIINKYLITLSDGYTQFSLTYTNPSIDASQYSNSTKNLFFLAKWLYSVITFRGQQYSHQGLKQIGDYLYSQVRTFSFVEPAAANAQNELTTAAQLYLTKLGNG
jgi:hypothetical protein